MRYFVLSLIFASTAAWAEEKLHISPYLDDISDCKELASRTFDVDLNHEAFRSNVFRGVQYTPLYVAINLDCVAVGRDMLNRGANPNFGGLLGSPLFSALNKEKNSSSMAWTMMLLGAGADPHHRNGWIESSVDEYIENSVADGHVNSAGYEFYKKATSTENFPF